MTDVFNETHCTFKKERACLAAKEVAVQTSTLSPYVKFACTTQLSIPIRETRGCAPPASIGLRPDSYLQYPHKGVMELTHNLENTQSCFFGSGFAKALTTMEKIMAMTNSADISTKPPSRITRMSKRGPLKCLWAASVAKLVTASRVSLMRSNPSLHGQKHLITADARWAVLCQQTQRSFHESY